jgi:deoxyribose-phosphate aldolase
LIDHTVLRPDATPDDIERGAREALDHGVAAYCVNPCHVDRVVPLLAGSPVVVCSVAGFPLGSSRTSTKVHEAFDSLSRGAREIDMVINIGLLRSGGYGAVRDDVAAVAEAVRSGGGVSKVILETALLTDRDIVAGCLIILEVGADFVKTSTGFSREGATVRGVALLHALAGGQLGIKAAGGIRTREAALTMVAAGATRIGTSSSATILTEPER